MTEMAQHIALKDAAPASRPRFWHNLPFWGLLPGWLLMGFALLPPIAIIAAVSLASRGAYGGFEWDFSLAGYRQILFVEGWSGQTEFTGQYLVIILRTLILAGITTLLCLLVAVPVAYYIAGQSPTRKAILVYLITLPFWVSVILRVYAWMIILGRDGTLIEAAHDLYGNRWLTLRRVILPLTAPGLVSGAILVFVPSLGAVLEPTLMGGGKQMMMGSLIQMQFTSARNWPFGAAIAITLLVFVMIVLILSARRATSKETTA